MKSPLSNTLEFFTLECSPMGGIPDFKCPGWLNGGQKSKPQKTPRASNKTQKNLWSKINPQNIACQISKPWKKSQNKFGCTLFVELCLWEYGGATTNLQIVLNTPKNPYLNQATPKKYFTNFPNPKNPRIKDLKPKKVLRSSPPLEIRSTPPPPPPGSVAKDGWGQSWDACDTH